MSDTTPTAPLVVFTPEEIAGIGSAMSGLVAARKQGDSAMIDALGSDFRVTSPDAPKSAAGVELTAEQVAGQTVRGRLESLTFQAAFDAFTVETQQPYRLRVKAEDAERFQVGGRVSGGGLPKPYYVVAPPRPLIVGDTVVSADVLLDTEQRQG